MQEVWAKQYPSEDTAAFSCRRCKELVCTHDLVDALYFIGEELHLSLAKQELGTLLAGRSFNQLEGPVPSVRLALECSGCETQLGYILKSAPPALAPLLNKHLVRWDLLLPKSLRSWRPLQRPSRTGFRLLQTRGENYVSDSTTRQMKETLELIRKSGSTKQKALSAHKRLEPRRSRKEDSALFEETYSVLQYFGQVVSGLQERSRCFQAVLREYQAKFKEQIPAVEKLLQAE